jgi:hypothetical protein
MDNWIDRDENRVCVCVCVSLCTGGRTYVTSWNAIWEIYYLKFPSQHVSNLEAVKR